MRRALLSLAILLAAAAGVTGQARVDGPKRYSEKGVEVVDNGDGVYALPGGPRRLVLREEFRIDLADDRLAAEGLGDIVALDADSEGRIYLFRAGLTPGPFIYRFDARGAFVKSFAKMGQGPEEVEYPHFVGMTSADGISVFSQGAQKFVTFNADGRVLGSIPFPPGQRLLPGRFRLLPNGKFLGQYARLDEKDNILAVVLCLLDGGLKKIMDIREYPIPADGGAFRSLLAHLAVVGVGPDAFYVNWGDEGRDIAVFDLDGRLRRIVRARFPTPPVHGEMRKAMLALLPQGRGTDNARRLVQSLRELPAFQSLVADENGRLFAAGSEKDPATGADICGIFTPEGIRFLRTPLGYSDLFRRAITQESFDPVVRNGRAYVIHEKADGFKEIIVSSFHWE